MNIKTDIRLSAPPDKLKITVDNDVARCPNCTRPIGTVVGRNILIGEVIVTNRLVCRCRSCKEKLLWQPLGLTSDST